MNAEREALLRRIGVLMRGDWSMTCWDGRDVQRWIETALDGRQAELDALGYELNGLESL